MKLLTPKHSGDLGVATKEPRKGRPAATGRVLMRLVIFCWLGLQALAHHATPNIAADLQIQTPLSELKTG